MKRFLFLAVLSLVPAASSFAQRTAPQFEVFGGATWIRADISPDLKAFGLSHVNATGWNASATENVNSWFGGTLDFSGVYSRPTITDPVTGATFSNQINASAYTFLFGPSFAYRRGRRIVPFGRVLLGAANARASTTSQGALAIGTAAKSSDTRFALAAGGGADILVSHSIALRGTADWIRSTFNDFGDDRQNNLRISVGVVFRWSPER